jgi:hypothetical protein
MSNTITGVVLGIRDTETVAGKDPARPLKKRKIMLDCTRRDQFTGERSEYENTPVLEFTGERVSEIDKCQVGDVVEIAFAVEGRNYTGKDGQPRNYTGVRAFGLEVRRRASQQAQQPTVIYPSQQPKATDDLPF